MCSLPLLRRPACMACIYALCVLTWVVVLFVCLSGAHVSLAPSEKRLGKELLSWSLVSPLPHSCQDDCSTESVWGWHASAEEVFIIPLLFKTLGARRVQQPGVCTRAAPAKLQSRPTLACLGELTQLSEWTLRSLQRLLPPVLLAWVCLGYLTPHQPEDSFLLVQPYDISSPSNSHKLFLPPKMPSSAPVQNTEAGLQVITCTRSNGLESPPSSLFSVTVCLCNSSTNTIISLIW